jgi:hypothetical protein
MRYFKSFLCYRAVRTNWNYFIEIKVNIFNYYLVRFYEGKFFKKYVIYFLRNI